MSRRPRRGTSGWKLLVLATILALAVVLVACAPTGDGGSGGTGTQTGEPTGSGEPTDSGGADLDGATLVKERCTACHTIDRIEATSEGRAGWTEIVDLMIARGARLDAAERETVIAYLAERYPER